MRGPDVWASETYKLLAPYQNKRPGRVLALNKGRWGLPNEKRGEFLQHYLAEREQYKFGLVLLKTETHPHVMDVDYLELASAVGSPVEILKIVLDVFTEALGDSAHLGTRVMLETRQDKRFHAVFPDLAVNERAGVALHRRHVQLLSEHHPAIKWRDIVDESVVKKNGLRMLGSYKYDDVRDERGKVKRFEFTTDTGVVKGYTKKACLEADGFYVPCAIDWETGVIEEQPITLEAIEARSLCRPNLSATDVVTVLGSDSSPEKLTTPPKIQGRASTIPTGSDEDKAVVLGLLELLKGGTWMTTVNGET
ncbi:g4022 [Coccomyxa viridis]|uniref:G4022 protein n=1 Tax=Coccomyxa viridis TaxID=1274662 RepID=A0ABP1FP92_9CHLO